MPSVSIVSDVESYANLALIAVGDTPTAPMRDLAADLEEILGLAATVVTARLPLPDEAYDVRRGQHLAPRVLGLLRSLRASADTLVLGVANSDLYAPGLSFVFGQADTLGGVSTISLTRLYPAFYGRPHDVPTFRRRAAIEGVHETGHLLQIPHCPDRHCVMYFSSTIVDSDRKGPLFCPRCRDQADRVVVPARALIASATADGSGEPSVG